MNMDHNINKSILFLDTVIYNIIPLLSENKYDKDCIVDICSRKASQKRSLDIFRLQCSYMLYRSIYAEYLYMSIYVTLLSQLLNFERSCHVWMDLAMEGILTRFQASSANFS